LLDSGHAIDDNGRHELLAGIADEAEHMEHFINNLLDMTRLESGGQKPRREQYPLQELVASTLQRLRKKIGDRRVIIDIPEDLPLLYVDGTLFEQVLINLVDNALQYTPADSPIRISGKNLGKSVEILVQDRGPGLPPDEPQRVFQKFYRSAAGANHSGIGLGLAICRGIVELHGGTITAANRDGGGAAFVITLTADSIRPGKPAMIENPA
jgi:two-component system sensor histidine kinase KdpD